MGRARVRRHRPSPRRRRAGAGLGGGGGAVTYLYRAAVNLSLTIVQTRRRRALTEDSEGLAASLPARASSGAEELHRKLYEAIAQLKPKAAAIVILRYLHNHSDAEIAKMLGTSRGVIAVTLYRSRAHLKKLLAASLDTKRRLSDT